MEEENKIGASQPEAPASLPIVQVTIDGKVVFQMQGMDMHIDENPNTQIVTRFWLERAVKKSMSFNEWFHF